MSAITGDVTIGVVANPASGRDIRRLVASASVFPTAEKANMVQRMLTAFGSVGVSRAMLSADLGGISAAVARAANSRRAGKDAPWPDLRFVDEDGITGRAEDTANAVRRMVADGARVIVCLGGDGTARVAAAACGDVPLLALSTGTNNAFPQMREATVAGLAAGLVAVGAVTEETALTRAGALEVVTSTRRELALVDVCASAARHIGSKALWDPRDLHELYCTFAEPDAIGLSSVPGQLCPSARGHADGVGLRLAPADQARYVVHAPIAPGLVVPVGVMHWWPVRSGESFTVAPAAAWPRGGGPPQPPVAVIAVDGEREIELAPGDTATVTLVTSGPRCIDVRRVMTEAARRGLLRRERSPACRPPGHDQVPQRTEPAPPSPHAKEPHR